MSKLEHPAARFTKNLEDGAAGLLLAAIIVLSCLQIVLRGLFHVVVTWIDPLVRYLVVWAGLFGAVIATREGRHIAIDLVIRHLPEKAGRLLAGLLSLASGLVCLALAAAAWRFVCDEMTCGGRELLGLGSGFWLSALPLAFILMAGRFIGRGIAVVTGRAALVTQPSDLELPK